MLRRNAELSGLKVGDKRATVERESKKENIVVCGDEEAEIINETGGKR